MGESEPVDRSFQTDARAEPVRPETGTASGASEERLAAAADLYDRAANELDLAAAHARRAADHFRDGEVPRGAAHAWAARGYLLEAGDLLDEQAREHGRRSNA